MDASDVKNAFGGKGGNQALTCGRLGYPVEMLAQLGNDSVGQGYLKYFGESNVGVNHTKLLEDGVPSGQAYIMSLKSGDNSIIIVGGANTHYKEGLTALDEDWVKAIKSSKVLLLQREIPEFVNVLAAKTAKENNTLVILDVGGRDEPLSPELLQYIDIISPNETELERVIHKKTHNQDEVRQEISLLLEKYPNMKVLLKEGENGSTIFENKGGKILDLHKPALSFEKHPHLKLVDTTGAGDCFTGAFACKMLEGESLENALEFANTVGFLCITKFGAGPSCPYK